MASETNELTFVRCPTCRSLVPASASKCRICNAALDVAAKSPTGEEAPPSGGRVRQKTVSAGAEEIRNIVGAGAPPVAPQQRPAPPVANVAPSAVDVAQQQDDSFDPLGAFLQDLDSAPENEPAPFNPPRKEPVEAPVNLFDGDDEDDDLDDLDDFDDLDEMDDLDDFDLDIIEDTIEQPEQDEVKHGSAEPEVEVAPQEELDGEFAQVGEVIEPTKPPVKEPGRQPVSREVKTPERPVATQSAKPKVSQEIASPKSAQTSSVATPGPIRPKIGGMPGRPQAKPPVAEARPKERQAPVVTKGAEQRERAASAPAVAQRAPIKPSAEPAPTNARRSAASEGASRAPARQAAERTPAVFEDGEPRPQKTKPGRLLGWLVSYENPDGRAIELRAGRFFVTGTSIRGSDLILEDQSISTPHALMAISEDAFHLQDLMSERGTFVRLQGEAQYSRQDGVIELRYGDWIRFGDVEFLVVVVPS